MPEFERVWNAGVATMKGLLSDVDALGFLDTLESRIASKGFKRRTLEAIEKQGRVEITGYEDRYAGDFAKLNYQWIQAAYEIEGYDRKLLDDPGSKIIDTGGEILFALVDGEVAGTVALIEIGNGEFELAKMAVDPEFRGYGIGEQLMNGCVEYSNRAGKRSIILESNTRQIAALALYRKAGFKEIPMDPNSPYTRANIRMELIL